MDPNLPHEQFQLKFRELQQARSELTDKQREELRRGRRGGRGPFDRRIIANYASLPAEKKQAFLDEQIDAMEKWQEQMAAAGQQQGGSAQDHRGPPPGGNFAGQRGMNWRKQMLDFATPADRAQVQIYFQDLNNRTHTARFAPDARRGLFLRDLEKDNPWRLPPSETPVRLLSSKS